MSKQYIILDKFMYNVQRTVSFIFLILASFNIG